MDITQIVIAIIGLIVAVISTVVYPLLLEKLGATTVANLEIWVGLGVKAAEQVYKGSGRGEEKKAYVLNFLSNMGVKADLEAIDRAIEAAVFDLNKNKEAK